jgi:hypothetical protein
MTTTQALMLYTRDGCHLCEQAMTLLDQAGIAWRPVDIDDDPALAEKYGLRIPVLRRPDTGNELYYPFDESAVRQFTRRSP